MAIPEEFRGRVLAYCQEPEPEEADLLVLDQAWDSAESYLKGAGVTCPGPENAGRLALWLSVMLAMVLDEYDQRGAQFDAGKLQDLALIHISAARKNFPMRWEAKVMDRETIKRQIQLYHGDCLVGMERVESGSVDLILCDLPYGTTDCSWDTVIPFEPLWACLLYTSRY